MKLIINIVKIFGICLLRFPLIPRVWCVWLGVTNLGCLAFLSHVEAQVVLGVTGVAVIFQALVYDRLGFTRILGTAHVLWIPMFAWMATRLEVIQAHPELSAWLAVLFATNLVSFVVDLTDAIRFLRGERAPHYRWASTNPT